MENTVLGTSHLALVWCDCSGNGLAKLTVSLYTFLSSFERRFKIKDKILHVMFACIRIKKNGLLSD